MAARNRLGLALRAWDWLFLLDALSLRKRDSDSSDIVNPVTCASSTISTHFPVYCGSLSYTELTKFTVIFCPVAQPGLELAM